MLGSELKTRARFLIMENAPKIFAVSLVFVILFSISSELQVRLSGLSNLYGRYMERVAAGSPHSLEMLFSFISAPGTGAAALLMLLIVVFRFGFRSYCLKTVRSVSAGVREIFSGFLFFGKVLLILAISTALTALWSLLFFFPAIAAYYRYRLAYYILLDDPGKSAMQCIRESKLLMSGNKLDLFLIDLSFFGWYAASMVLSIILSLLIPFSFPILYIWISPYAGLTRAEFYDRMLESAAS